MDFTTDMLQRAQSRRSRSDQIDKHIIALASGIPYNELTEMLQRDYDNLLDQLRMEVIPWVVQLGWADERWQVIKCNCECICDDCTLFLECKLCECGGEVLASFPEIRQSDIERVNQSGNPDYTRLVKMMVGEEIKDWRLKKYKTVEMALARTLKAPLPGNLNLSTPSPTQE